MNPMERALERADKIIAADQRGELGATPTKLPNYSELTPAYGRDYTSAAKAKAAFLEGADFVLASTGQYTSIRDVAPGTTILLRYKRHTQVTTVKVTRLMLEKAEVL